MTEMLNINETLDSTTEIYIEARENYNFCYRMHYSDSQAEYDFLSTDTHVNFIRYSLWQLTIINVCKLYSDKSNDKYNISKTLNQLGKDGHFRKLAFDQSKLTEWQEILESKRGFIGQLNILRDKLYAHTDRNRKHFSNFDIKFKRIAELLDLALQIINGINIAVKRPVLIYDSPYFNGQDFTVIKALTEYYSKFKFH